MNGAVETEYVPQNILITGGAGFIGSHVAVRLLERYPQYRVRTTMVVWGLSEFALAQPLRGKVSTSGCIHYHRSLCLIPWTTVPRCTTWIKCGTTPTSRCLWGGVEGAEALTTAERSRTSKSLATRMHSQAQSTSCQRTTLHSLFGGT